MPTVFHSSVVHSRAKRTSRADTMNGKAAYLVQQDADIVALIAKVVRVALLCQVAVCCLDFAMGGIVINLHGPTRQLFRP